MICVYAQDCTDFSSNGLGTLIPESAEVNETINGEYELKIVHPLDETGKWQRLVEGFIIRAPVPVATTPAIDVETETVVTRTEIYKVNTNRDPLRLRSGPGTGYKVLSTYKKGTQVIILNKYSSSWYEVSCPDGKHGYMATTYLTYYKTVENRSEAESEVVDAHEVRDQPFRIYRVVPELDKVTVYARHIFYDLMDNMVKTYTPSNSATGAQVIKGISDACLSDHPFTFYSDLDSTAEEVEFTNMNPVDCLLGTDGVIEKYGGELVRDWYDVFIVKRVGADTNIQIREGKNLTGIKYDLDITDVSTRIMPTGENEDGSPLYLPEIYIDSPHINDYPNPKWKHLEVSEAKVVTSGNNQRTASQCYTIMRKAVQDEFDKGCDEASITLTVDFVNVTDTEEYKPYGFLHSIFLGDAVRVIAKRIGVAVSMRMTEYTYDCIKKKYIKMVLGNPNDIWIPSNMRILS